MNIAHQMPLAKPMPAPRKKTTQQARIDALLKALSTISAQTKGYDEFSQIGCLHDIAHKALLADILRK